MRKMTIPPTIQITIAKNAMPVASQELGLVSAEYRRQVIIIRRII